MGPRAVLVAIEAINPSWAEQRENPHRSLPVSQSALRPVESPMQLTGPVAPGGIVLVRETAGLSQADLALILGVDKERVSQLERGKRPTNRLEADVLVMLGQAIAPMVNAADAAAWGQSIARLAKEHGPLRAILQIIADGANWRWVGR